MTEQFSQEYIEFMQSDEAKVLQAGHELKCWDFFVWEGEIYVVTGLGCDGIYAAKADGRGKASWLNAEEDLSGRELWLPILSQLIGVIEGAGWEWRRFAGLFLGWPHKPPIEEPVGFDDKDIMLAAAQLAVRAIGGKE